MRISDWSSDVCSSDLPLAACQPTHEGAAGCAGRQAGTVVGTGDFQLWVTIGDDDLTLDALRHHPLEPAQATQREAEDHQRHEKPGVFLVALLDRTSTRLNSSH